MIVLAIYLLGVLFFIYWVPWRHRRNISSIATGNGFPAWIAWTIASILVLIWPITVLVNILLKVMKKKSRA